MKSKIQIDNKTILATGAAGFIGSALVQRILRECSGCLVVGLDNMNDYYNPALKEYRCRLNEQAAVEGACSYQFIRDSGDRGLRRHGDTETGDGSRPLKK